MIAIVRRLKSWHVGVRAKGEKLSHCLGGQFELQKKTPIKYNLALDGRKVMMVNATTNKK